MSDINTTPNAQQEQELFVLTIRLIRSFEYRNVKNFIVKCDPSITSEQLMQTIRSSSTYFCFFKKKNLIFLFILSKLNQSEINTDAALVPFRTKKFDTLKIHHKPFGFKANNLVINFEHDENWILLPHKTLIESGVGL